MLEVKILRAKNKKPINILIGENIRFYREEANYSREKFAELVGITPRFLADVETGFAGVSLTNLKRICEILGVSSDRLIWQQENELGLDEKVKHVDSKYVAILEEVIQKQLEIIAIATKEENSKKVRK